MSVLMWVAVLVGMWCAASVVAALALGAYLRHRGSVAAEKFETLRRLDTGPLSLWLSEIPDQRAVLDPVPERAPR